MTDQAIHAKLLEGLSRADEQTREQRVQRIEWLGSLPAIPNALVGRSEQIALLDEMKRSFIAGHNVAVVLTATALVEHTLVEELRFRNATGSTRTLEATIASARQAGLFKQSDVLDRADHLRKIRNPFVHFQDNDSPYSLASRFRNQQTHPLTVLEADARNSVQVAYEIFVGTVRAWP